MYLLNFFGVVKTTCDHPNKFALVDQRNQTVLAIFSIVFELAGRQANYK